MMRWICHLLFLWAGVAALCTPSAATTRVPGDPLAGDGSVHRAVLTYSELFSSANPTGPVDDSDGFAVPANAAAPSESFEGTLTLSDPATGGDARILRDDFGDDSASNSPWRHLPSFSFQFVQNGSYFVPARQGLVITGNAAWNYIVGPGECGERRATKVICGRHFPLPWWRGIRTACTTGK